MTPSVVDRLPISWNLVSVVRDYLAKRGCMTTLCMDPRVREAHLVLWPGADRARAVALLAELNASQCPLGGWLAG